MMARNPEGHSPKYWHKHAEKMDLSANQGFDVATGTSAERSTLPNNVHSWFALRPKGSKAEREKVTEVTGLVSDCVLAFILAVLSLPVLARWACWWLCWIGALYFVLHRGLIDKLPVDRLPGKTQTALLLILASIFVPVAWKPAHRQWREEKSTATSGILHSTNPGWKKGHPPTTTNNIEFGQSNVMIGVDLPPAEEHKDFLTLHDYARLRIEKGDTELELTTTVRGRKGEVVATIEKNRWTVYPPFCLDKNYTKDSLEVKDSRGHIVLQVRILPDRIQLEGEWNDEYGKGMRMIQSPYEEATKDHPGPGGLFISWDNPQQAEVHDTTPNEEIKPWFQYPSFEHWAEWMRPETN